jgi:hypothetical protein
MNTQYYKICHFLFMLLVATAFSCIEPYDPNVLAQQSNYLVADAHLDASAGVVNVKLSRTIPLESTDPIPLESNATVTMEDDNGTIFNLQADGNGRYSRSGLSVDMTRQYRMHIRTGGEEYYSEFTSITTTPPIENLYWLPAEDGVQIYVDTRDPSGNAQYFKWDYTSTAEYTAAFGSIVKLVNGVVYPRPPSEYMYYCWITDNSTEIMIGSTERLQESVISHFPVAFIKRGDFRISRKYSILVKQQAISEEAFNYWTQLKRTTESLGGLFDPMPNQITGNFYNTKSTEPVLGFFSGTTIQEKRIYINYTDLPDELRLFSRSGCVADSIPVNTISLYGNSTLLIDSYGYPVILGYLSAATGCIDCRTKGGTTVKPLFWE